MRALVRATSLALVLLSASAGAAVAQGGGLKLAYIQSSVLLEQAPGRAEAESQFDRETGTYRDQIKRMNDSLGAMITSFERTQAAQTPAAREASAKQIRTREEEYQRRTRDLEQQAQKRQGELVQPILDRIKQAIEDVRAEGGYAMILNADSGSPIVAVDKSLNVTDRVLARLRTTASAAPRPAAGAAAAPRAGGAGAAPSGVTRPATPPNR
jgi:outer membrane protein